MIKYIDCKSRLREESIENVLAIYGELRCAEKYIWPTFTMLTKNGTVRSSRRSSEPGLWSELMVPCSGSMTPICLGREYRWDENRANGRSDFELAWKDCSKPKNGAEKLCLDQWTQDGGIKVKWINTITVCAVCLRTIKLNEPLGFAENELLHLRYKGEHNNTTELFNELNKHTKDRYWYYGIHQECNPRNQVTKLNLIKYFKLEKYEEKLIKMGLRKHHPKLDLIKTLSDCWPAYAKIYKQIIGNATTTKTKERVVRQWIKRNQNKASTESARNFFKLAFGINNLTKYTNDINIKQHQQNRRIIKSGNPMLARSR